MKILTWNINGIRASKRCLRDVLDSLDADVICLQETKITRDMLDEPSAIVEGYNAYFSFSRKRSGYSGTANFCKDAVTPVGAEEGLGGQLSSQSEGSIGCVGNIEQLDVEELRSLDGEGRAVLTQHHIQLGGGGVKDLVVINVYVPRAAERDDRLTYKLHFLALLQCRAEALLRHGRHVIVLGDLNLTHKRIDHCDPSSQEFVRADSRQWLDQFLRPEDRDPDLALVEDKRSFEATLADAEGGHFIDAFRYFHTDRREAYTNWTTATAARQTNYGKRLDYILVDQGLQDCLEDCRILADFEGSDHCPVVLHLRCQPCPAPRCPPLCTRWMPEFQGRQQKLSRFFSSSSSTTAARKPGPVTQAQDASGRDRGEQAGAGGGSQGSQPPSQSDSSPLLPEEGDGERKSPHKAPLKRACTDDSLESRGRKKKKGKGEKVVIGGGGSRQGSLLQFWHRPSGPTSSGPVGRVNHVAKYSDVSLPACQQDCTDQARSPYWGLGGKGNSHPSSTPPSTQPQDQDSPRPSPTKLCLPSLSLLPCRGVETSAPSSDSSPEAGAASDSTASQGQSDQHQQEEPEERTPGSRTEAAPDSQAKAKCVWKNLLSGPAPPPPCKGHREPCVLRTVKKAGPTKGRQFYVCARPEGHSANKDARCEHFQWVGYMASGKKSKP
ncbi:hypothetical protein ACOMHN_056353 [Nucella lapillus]